MLFQIRFYIPCVDMTPTSTHPLRTSQNTTPPPLCRWLSMQLLPPPEFMKSSWISLPVRLSAVTMVAERKRCQIEGNLLTTFQKKWIIHNFSFNINRFERCTLIVIKLCWFFLYLQWRLCVRYSANNIKENHYQLWSGSLLIQFTRCELYCIVVAEVRII